MRRMRGLITAQHTSDNRSDNNALRARCLEPVVQLVVRAVRLDFNKQTFQFNEKLKMGGHPPG